MTTNLFSTFKDPNKLVVWRGRRVAHSARDYFTSIDRSSFTAKNIIATTMNSAGQIGGALGGGVGATAIAVGATAAGTIAGAGFIAAVSGPQVAVTAAVIGIALIIWATYSNRESAHADLSDFVWTFVDDEKPLQNPFGSSDNLAKATGAAATLMDDGKNQIKVLGNKLAAAQAKFQAVNTAIATGKRNWETAKDELAAAQASRLPNNQGNIDIKTNMLAQKVRAVKTIWETESKPGGGIHQYVRRCVHTCNYLQASHIIAMAMKEKLAPGSVIGKIPDTQDYFAGVTLADNVRASFANLSAMYETVIT